MLANSTNNAGVERQPPLIGRRKMKDRNENIARVKETIFDLLIIGAGLTGAALAREAAARGLKPLLIDKSDFASGASSRSNQLIHGKAPEPQAHLKPNKQYLSDAESLKKLAPHLVREISLALPLLQNNTFFNLKASAGITLNEVFSVSSGQAQSNTLLNKQKLSNLVPALTVDLTSGGIQFSELITDDSRFVLGLINDAQNLGATVINYAEVCALSREADQTFAAAVRDRYLGADLRVSARAVVNATGAWAPETSKLLPSAAAEYIDYFSKVKITQVVVPASSFETNSGLLLPTKLGGHVYVMPWHHALLIGSAETEFSGTAEDSNCETATVNQLLNSVNEFTKTDKLSQSDVRSTITCVSSRIKSSCPQNLSGLQNCAIFESDEGVFTAFMGRLDCFAKFSNELLRKVSKKASLNLETIKVNQTEMIGGWTSKDDFLASSSHIEAKARRVGIEPACIRHLLSSYGASAIDIVDLVERKESLKARIIPDFPPIMAELPYAVISEMAVSLQDVLLRRTRLAMLSKKLSMEAAPRVAEAMASLLGWDAYRTQVEVQVLEEQIAAHPQEAKLANS